MTRFLRPHYLLAAMAATVVFSCIVTDTSAATQGTLGNTSTGTLNISVTKPARANITGLSDLILPGWTPAHGAVTLTDDLCVYSTRPGGGYTVKATGSGAGGAFTLANGGSTLIYTITWNSGGVNNLANTGVNLTAGTTSNARSNAAMDSATCNGTVPGPTARLVFKVTNARMVAATQGTYSGVLTMLITPN